MNRYVISKLCALTNIILSYSICPSVHSSYTATLLYCMLRKIGSGWSLETSGNIKGKSV